MKIFVHSWKDGILVALAFAQIALVVWTTLNATTLPVAWTAGLGAALVFLICTNFQCVAHNFIHNPFFSSERLNRAFSVINTLCIGFPQSLYDVHHHHHHKYNNDAKDPATGSTHDLTSTFRFGKGGNEEGILTYAMLGVLRGNLGYLWNEAWRKGLVPLVMAELTALALFIGVLAAADWRGFVVFYLPTWYLGNVAAMAENYLEHHGAIPGDRRTDSVSAYGWLYNLIWFNNGYHQEHHLKPHVHWTEVPGLRGRLPPETSRRVVRAAHWFNFFPPPRTTYRKA